MKKMVCSNFLMTSFQKNLFLENSFQRAFLHSQAIAKENRKFCEKNLSFQTRILLNKFKDSNFLKNLKLSKPLTSYQRNDLFKFFNDLLLEKLVPRKFFPGSFSSLTQKRKSEILLEKSFLLGGNSTQFLSSLISQIGENPSDILTVSNCFCKLF